MPTGWKIDLHLPDKRFDRGFEGDAFIAQADFGDYPQPYWIPYRCLYSRNVSNLFMAGRCISVTHEALGAVRVMRTCGCMGECVGRAASVCKQRGGDPRDVYAKYLDEFLELLRRPLSNRPAAGVQQGLGANAAREAKRFEAVTAMARLDLRLVPVPEDCHVRQTLGPRKEGL